LALAPIASPSLEVVAVKLSLEKLSPSPLVFTTELAKERYTLLKISLALRLLRFVLVLEIVTGL